MDDQQLKTFIKYVKGVKSLLGSCKGLLRMN
jgi:hypothetical protein